MPMIKSLAWTLFVESTFKIVNDRLLLSFNGCKRAPGLSGGTPQNAKNRHLYRTKSVKMPIYWAFLPLRLYQTHTPFFYDKDFLSGNIIIMVNPEYTFRVLLSFLPGKERLRLGGTNSFQPVGKIGLSLSFHPFFKNQINLIVAAKSHFLF